MCGRPDLPRPAQHGNGDKRDEQTGPIERTESVHQGNEGSQAPHPVSAPGGEWGDGVPVEDAPVEPVVQPEEEVTSPELSLIDEKLDSIHTSLTNLLDDARTQLRSRDELIRELTTSLDEAKRDQAAGLLAPLARKLVNISVKAEDAAGKDYAELPPERLYGQVKAEFDYFAELLVDALELIGFVEIDAEEGDPFDARRHVGVDRVPTSDPEADKTIAKVLRPGYTYEHSRKAEFPARVSVYAFTEPASVPTQEPAPAPNQPEKDVTPSE